MSIQRLTRLPRLLSRRHPFSTSSHHHNPTPFQPSPSPPRLPKQEQEIFERLQKASTGAFSTPKSSSPDFRTQINQSPDLESGAKTSSRGDADADADADAKEGDVMHPNLRRGAPPEFEGDVNPKTGEVGGPKNDPLRWKGDWSFNGRVTDF